MTTVIINDNPIDFSAAIMLMDDDLRDQAHSELAPCTDQMFVDRYCELHAAKYGKQFTVN